LLFLKLTVEKSLTIVNIKLTQAIMGFFTFA
jgi:hypothetical protein